MANPELFPIKEKQVVKVATAVTGGTINKHPLDGRDLTYIGSYKLTGESAPTYDDMTKRDGKLLFKDDPEQEQISASESIDVYITCNKEDSKSQYGYVIVNV